MAVTSIALLGCPMVLDKQLSVQLAGRLHVNRSLTGNESLRATRSFREMT